MYSTTNGAEGTINPAALSSGKEIPQWASERRELDATARMIMHLRTMRLGIPVNAAMIYKQFCDSHANSQFLDRSSDEP
jgi:hypothetical protein